RTAPPFRSGKPRMLKHQLRHKTETATVARGDALVTIRVRRPGLGRPPVIAVDLHGSPGAVFRDADGGWYEVRHPAGVFRFWLLSPDREPGRLAYHWLVIAADRAWRI